MTATNCSTPGCMFIDRHDGPCSPFFSETNSEFPTEMAKRICQQQIPAWRTLFLEKNAKYRAVSDDLGARGVFPDVNRKVGILRDRVWDGNTTIGEGTIEVINDLIGHLFIMQDMLIQEAQDAEEQP